MKSSFCNFRNLVGQKLWFKDRSCWGNIQFLHLIYLLRHKYLEHSSWLHSTLCTYVYENGRYSLQFCRKTLSEIGIGHSKPLIVPSKGCVKGSFFLFFQHTIEARKRKAQNIILKFFIALESENNKFQDFSLIPYVHVLAIIACLLFQQYLLRY